MKNEQEKIFSGKIKVQNGCILNATILITKSSFESMKNKNWKSNWSNFKPIYFLHSLRVRGGFEKKSLNSTSISWQHMTTIWKHTFFGLKNLNWTVNRTRTLIETCWESSTDKTSCHFLFCMLIKWLKVVVVNQCRDLPKDLPLTGTQGRKCGKSGKDRGSVCPLLWMFLGNASWLFALLNVFWLHFCNVNFSSLFFKSCHKMTNRKIMNFSYETFMRLSWWWYCIHELSQLSFKILD